LHVVESGHDTLNNNTEETQDAILNEATEAKDATVEATAETTTEKVVSAESESANPFHQTSETPVHDPNHSIGPWTKLVLVCTMILKTMR